MFKSFSRYDSSVFQYKFIRNKNLLKFNNKQKSLFAKRHDTFVRNYFENPYKKVFMFVLTLINLLIKLVKIPNDGKMSSQDMISQVPPIVIEGLTAPCDGGSI